MLFSCHKLEVCELLITLEEAKLYLRVDGVEDDSLILHFISTAECICEDVLRRPLEEFDPAPESIKNAVLFLVANLYEQREEANIKDLIDFTRRLLQPYRLDGW